MVQKTQTDGKQSLSLRLFVTVFVIKKQKEALNICDFV